MVAPTEAFQLYVTEVPDTLLPLAGKDRVGASEIDADGVSVGVGIGVGVGVESGVTVGVGVVTTSLAQPMIPMTSDVTSKITIRLLNFPTFCPSIFVVS